MEAGVKLYTMGDYLVHRGGWGLADLPLTSLHLMTLSSMYIVWPLDIM